MIHPTAGCIDSPTNPRGVPSCLRVGQPRPDRGVLRGQRAVVPERARGVLVQLPHVPRDHARATSGRRTSTASTTTPDAPPRSRADPSCFAADRAVRARALLVRVAAAVREREGLPGRGRRDAQHGARRRATSAYGRRTFVWHGGGEVVLRYDQHNVLGFATDFAEDLHPDELGRRVHLDRGRPVRATPTCRHGITDTDELNLPSRWTGRRSSLPERRSHVLLQHAVVLELPAGLQRRLHRERPRERVLHVRDVDRLLPGPRDPPARSRSTSSSLDSGGVLPSRRVPVHRVALGHRRHALLLRAHRDAPTWRCRRSRP